jgi:hypothetical protein
MGEIGVLSKELARSRRNSSTKTNERKLIKDRKAEIINLLMSYVISQYLFL